ncbi:MAG: nucleoside-diphosphate kinase [Planctomycetes bacterium]|nr:nucleoside-diphosphate kinase [Planctomycetota bacterium]
MNTEKTLIIIKPDAVQRQLVGQIVSRFEQKGMKFAGLKLIHVSKAQAENLYSVHKGKHFYDSLVEFITASPVVVCVIDGQKAISICRNLMGATFGPQAQPGTIRGDFGASVSYNLIHGSDSPESANREIPIFFSPSDILNYEIISNRWTYNPAGEK